MPTPLFRSGEVFWKIRDDFENCNEKGRKFVKFHKKLAVLSLAAAASLGTMFSSIPLPVLAEESSAVSAQSVTKAEKGSADNIVEITFENGNKGRLTFLDEGIFRWNIDPAGEFSNYAAARNASHTARIQQQPDSSDVYQHPAASISESDAELTITCGSTRISFDKATGKMRVQAGDKTVLEEESALNVSRTGTTQRIKKNEGEDFYGGGMQNGRFVHTGKEIKIANTNNWTDGGVASPNPFYWSTNGYGVLRNTFQQGAYDFGSAEEGVVSTNHSENEFDAYYFVTPSEGNANVAKDLLQSYFKVTGNPVLLPEYGFYLGHLNCYNRDSWSNESGSKGWTIKGSEASTAAGKTMYESGMATGYVIPEGAHAESLNGQKPTVNADNFKGDTPEEFSARAVIDRYQDNDVPFGWFLPNDGYGCGYGQNGYEKTGGTAEERQAALDANVKNLGEFTKYANEHGVSTGLWTQSNLTPIASEKQNLVRDFRAEVLQGGITSLKTDVAWVGSGYSFGLNGIKSAYDIVTNEAGKRPNIVTLDGWAGTQRYGTIWSGDQYGGQWEYIRFHIPTYVGQSLAGNPNMGSDMDGIFGGNPIIATRDYQWKTFTSTMLDMDGWGTYVKSPYTHGDPYTGISRMYLKLKAQLMPYIYTSAASAANIDTKNNDTGLPMIRAMMLADESDYAASLATQYQYMFGDDFVVAPVYQNTAADDKGNDIRNDIYLPGTADDTWIDYFTGKEYSGGQVISGFDAPLWKLPLFVRKGSIIPMYEENNNPEEVSETNPDGLDKTKRIVEFYAKEGSDQYTLYEDDGESINSTTTTDAEYGTINTIDYGDPVLTTFSYDVKGEEATFKAGKSTGSYEGYDSNRNTKFVINVSKEPSSVTINGAAGQKAASLEAFEALGDNESGWFYDAAPEMNKYAGEEAFSNTHIINSPKVYVKFAKTNVAANEQTAVVHGFEDADETSNVKDDSLAAITLAEPAEDALTPTSIQISWAAVEGAANYDVLVDGELIFNTDKPELLHSGLDYKSTHTYKVRARSDKGYGEWSNEITVVSLDDPWRNTPVPENIHWSGQIYGTHNPGLAFDHIFQSGDGGFHSNYGGVNDVMTIDYGKVYAFTNLEYYPRDDAGNGTVTKMDIAWSMDGLHWTEAPQQTWERSAEMKSFAINDTARYIRLIPRESVGTFFSASEIKIDKKDGTKGFALGSNLNNETVSDADYSNLKNYLALENRGGDASTFQAQIGDHYADLNKNGVYDVYDYSFTMAALDNGTTRTGEPEGQLFFLTDKSEAKAGDLVTVSLYGQNIKNANALGSIFHYDMNKFEAVVPGGSTGVTASPFLGDMENLSRVKDTYPDGKGTINIAFANRGDKDLYSGTRTVATFQLRAKADVTINGEDDSDLDLAQQTMVIGPTGGLVEAGYTHKFTLPEVPNKRTWQLAQSDLALTMTNEYYPTDDGTNVATLIQQGNYNGLFNGNNDTGDRSFEFIWGTDQNKDSGKFNEKVTTPVTLHAALNEPVTLETIDLYTGATTSNGRVLKVRMTVTFEDGSKQVFEGGEYDTMLTHYSFAISGDNLSKKVTNADLEILETGGAQGMQNLTLSEWEFHAYEGGAGIASIVPDESNAKVLRPGRFSAVNAAINPSSALNQFFTVESSDPEIVSVDSVQDDGVLFWFIRGNKAGTATITLKSAADPSKTASYEVVVDDSIDTAELDALIERANSLLGAGTMTDASAAALRSALETAQAAKDAAVDQDAIDQATVDFSKAFNNLQFKAPKEANLINKNADSGVTALGGTSDCGPGAGATEGEGLGTYAASLDKDDQTYWHTDWANHIYMPQHVLYDLGEEYDLDTVSFLPRQNGRNGDMFTVEILVGTEQDKLESVGVYSFEKSADGKRFADTTTWKTMRFAPTKARYVKVNVIHAGGDTPDSFASMSEINFYKFDPAVEAINTELLEESISKTVEASANIDFADFEEGDEVDTLKAVLDEARDALAQATTQEEVNAAAAKLNSALLNVRLVPSEQKLEKLS